MRTTQQRWDLAWRLFKNAEYKSAISQLDCLEKTITNEAIFFVKAQCLWRIGLYKQGIKYFEKAYKQSHHSEPLLFALVKSYLAHNKKKKAQKILDKASETKNTNQEIWFNKFLLSDIKISQADISMIVTGILVSNTINRTNGRLLCVCQVFGFHQQELKKFINNLALLKAKTMNCSELS